MPDVTPARFVALSFAAGAVLGSALDALHTHSGTVSYPAPVAFQMAWWTPLIFGLAGVGMLCGHPIAGRILGRPVVPESAAISRATAVALFVAGYAASGYLPASNEVKLLVLAVAAAIAFALVGRSVAALALAGVAAVAGSLVEITLVGAGAFAHLQPDVVGIPMWLPALYALASIAVGPLGAALASSASAPQGLQKAASGSA